MNFFGKQQQQQSQSQQTKISINTSQGFFPKFGSQTATPTTAVSQNSYAMGTTGLSQDASNTNTNSTTTINNNSMMDQQQMMNLDAINDDIDMDVTMNNNTTNNNNIPYNNNNNNHNSNKPSGYNARDSLAQMSNHQKKLQGNNSNLHLQLQQQNNIKNNLAAIISPKET